MAKTTIDWADRTWNVVTGCSKVSVGCDHCYAERMAKRLAGRAGYPKDDPFQVTVHDDKLYMPTNWRAGQRVFVNSMGDLFHADVRGVWIEDVLDGIIHQPKHDFLVLTKRPQRMLEFMTRFYAGGWVVGTEPWPLQLHHEPIPNLRLGVTAENQEMADERIPILLQVPAAVRFVSVEPMLGPIQMDKWLRIEGWEDSKSPLGFRWKRRWHHGESDLDWVILGGETGPGARPMHPDWVRGLRDQCQAARVPLFFKQWGEFEDCGPAWGSAAGSAQDLDGCVFVDPDGTVHRVREESVGEACAMRRVGKKAAGHLIDGQEHRQFPEVAA